MGSSVRKGSTPWPRFWNPEPGLTFPLPCHTIILYQIRQFGGACSAAEPRRLGDSGGLPAPSALLHQEGRLEFFPTGATVYSPSHFCRCLGILLAGRLQVTKGTLTVSYLEPGDLFGAAALYTEAPEFVTTITARQSSRCLMLPQNSMDRLLAQDGPLRENYLRYLTGRLQSLVQSGAEGKLARYLLANVREGQLTCAATDLARRLGLSRASLYRAFQSLEESGLISRHGKTISISDPAGLEGFL